MGLKLSDALPDETTILNFRHLLERNGLGKSLFEEINAHLELRGLKLREGTIVDASIIGRRRPPRTGPGNETRKCTRRRRGTSGISG